MMRKLLAAACYMTLLTACSTREPVDDNAEENQRFFGTVISVTRTKNVDWQGAGDVASAGTHSTADMLTGGIFSGLFGPSHQPVAADVGPEYGFNYLIATEDGRRVRVQSNDNRVYHAGEEVMVIENSSGFSNVYPRDLEHAHPGGL